MGSKKLSDHFHVQNGRMPRKANWFMASIGGFSSYADRRTFPGYTIERREESLIYPSINLATPNAAPAAAAPISITLNAPHHGCTPVSLLLNQPKTKRQSKVTTKEILNACSGVSIKKYGLKGTNP